MTSATRIKLSTPRFANQISIVHLTATVATYISSRSKGLSMLFGYSQIPLQIQMTRCSTAHTSRYVARPCVSVVRRTCPSLAPSSSARLAWPGHHGRICSRSLDRASDCARLLALDSGMIPSGGVPSAPWPAAVPAETAAASGPHRAHSCSAVYLEVDTVLAGARAHHKLSKSLKAKRRAGAD